MTTTHLVALAVILQATRPLAVAPLGVFPDGDVTAHVLRLPDLGPESVRISHQTILDSPLSVLLVVDIIEAIHAVAHVAELSVRETIAVQLEALALGAVARLSGPHTVRLDATCFARTHSLHRLQRIRRW